MELSLFWTLWLLIALVCLGTGVRLTQRRLQPPASRRTSKTSKQIKPIRFSPSARTYADQTSKHSKPDRRRARCARCEGTLRQVDRFCGYCGQEVDVLE